MTEAELVAIEQRAARLEASNPEWLLGLNIAEDIAELVAFVRFHQAGEVRREFRSAVRLYPLT